MMYLEYFLNFLSKIPETYLWYKNNANKPTFLRFGCPSMIWFLFHKQLPFRMCWKCHFVLTHWDRDDMDAITQTTFSSAFFWKKMFELWLISLKFAPKGSINNMSALVQIMVWCHPGDKPLSEPMMVSLLTHICVTRPQWVNPFAGHKIANNLANATTAYAIYHVQNL